MVAELNGYLDAIASMNGQYREYVASAKLLMLDSEGIESSVRKRLGAWYRPLEVVDFRQGKSWTEVEPFLQQVFLTEPLGEPSLGGIPNLTERRFILAFHASDLVMFLDENQSPKGIYHLTLRSDSAVSATGCVIEYDSDVLLLVHARWRLDAPSME